MPTGAQVIDGKALAARLREEVSAQVRQLPAGARVPGLAVVRVGDDPASEIYVRRKREACARAGLLSYEYHLPATVSRSELLDKVAALNADPAVDGILVQLPLPAHLDEAEVIESVDPEKDVDGFHPVNVGRLWSGLPGLVPCTPAGVMHLIASTGVALSGTRAVVVGRSNIVGKPMAALLLREHATVTICHSRTRDLPSLCREADVLVAAVGKPKVIAGDWVKRGAVVIDVGINRGSDGKLAGDVDFAAARERASHITPVPGGVGPMTIAFLLKNTWEAYRRRSAMA